MKIRWAGQAAFVMQAADKTIITDPFGEGYGYAAIPEAADVVTVSHGHHDHAAVERVQGNPIVIQEVGKRDFPGLTIEGFPSFHDKTEGSERGRNIMFKFSAEGMTLLHVGDLGEILSADKIAALGEIDILLLPVGSVYTIDGAEAAELVRKIRPKIAIPMHFKTPVLTMSRELDTVEAFTQAFDTVVYKAALDISSEALGKISDTEVYVLDYQ